VSELVKLAATLLHFSGLEDRLRIGWWRGSIALVLMSTAVPLAVAAIGCAGAALWLCLRPLLGAVGASLAAGGAFLLVSVVLVLIARRLLRGRIRFVPRLAKAARCPGNADKGTMLFAAFSAGLSAGAARRSG